jgi:O-methyltransferase involved in polyketide biosynthesis
MWNYWVGGKDHFASDRDAAERIIEAMPAMPQLARHARLFLADAVNQLVGLGVRQFLDIGTGLPTANNTHEVAQAAAPESRIVYVDYDPVVLAHARALLTSSPEGKTDYIEADLRDPDTILSEARRTLDFTEPIAMLLIGVLHFIPDADDPYGIVSRLIGALPAGSFLTIGHGASDIQPAEAAEVSRRYNQRSSAQIRMRTRDEVARFFDGLEMTTPGPVPLGQWSKSGKIEVGTASDVAGWCGIGRKP